MNGEEEKRRSVQARISEGLYRRIWARRRRTRTSISDVIVWTLEVWVEEDPARKEELIQRLVSHLKE